MTAWLSDEMSVVNPARAEEAAVEIRSSSALRAMDLVLVVPLLFALLLPLVMIVMLQGGFTRQRVLGRDGVSFDRLGFARPRGLWATLWDGVGAARWPVVLNILWGDMAWVGPRARAVGERVAKPCLRVRPGLVNPWFIRRRTAVDYGDEEHADLSYLAQRGLGHDTGLLLRGALVALLPCASGGSVPARVQLYDVAFDNVDMAQALNRLSALLDGNTAAQVCFVNPACVNIAASHRGYRRVLARACLVLPDGIGIKIGTALLGTPLKQNVNGTDLFPRLCDLLQSRGRSIYLLGGEPGVVDRVVSEIAERWPQLRVVGTRHGFFSTAEEGRVVADVRASCADVLLVARGVPGQDLFVDRYLPQLGVKVAIGVGGLFDFVSGRISRAPVWMRETGLEWIWRLIQEPGRMWRRYLVGNFTFLWRVVLQRSGLRLGHSPAGEAARTPQTPEAQVPAVRVVIFATPNASSDVPVAADCPLALMPLGPHTVVEKLLANLAQAGVSQVDLVASDRTDELRALLGDGSRWGQRLHWHLVKDPAHAYAVLDKPALRSATRLVVGHVDRCPSVASLQALQSADQWWVDGGVESGPHWAGWGSLNPTLLPGRCADLSRAALGLHGLRSGARVHLSSDQDGLPLRSANALLRAQPGASGELADDEVPPSWIRKPWGAMSPMASVDERASLVGPVLIGPGCIVPRGAQIGPHVVLSKDVVLSGDAHVERSLVMPGSYIGAGLDLTRCVVNGARVRHLRLGVEACLPPADALLLSLHDRASASTSWLGRLVASIVLLGAGPALLVHLWLRRAAGRAPAWVVRPVMLGRSGDSGTPEMVRLRLAPASSAGRAWLWCLLAGVMDVAAGRRAWFGVRPRLAGQWYAMRPEWQQVLRGRSVGLLYAPAWADDPAHFAEASAAADVFATVLSPLGRASLAVRALWQSPSSVAQGALS